MKDALILGLALLLAAPAWAQEPSFECSEAATPDALKTASSIAHADHPRDPVFFISTFEGLLARN